MILKRLCILIILQITVQISLCNTIQPCTKKPLHYYGVRAFCENSDGKSVSCSKSSVESNNVKKAFIQCEEAYKGNISTPLQKIECDLQNGKWSEEPVYCLPECINYPNEFKLISPENLKFPNGYAEIISKPEFQGNLVKIPGLVFDERKVLAKINDKYNRNDHDMSEDFAIRIYKSPTDYMDFEFRGYDCRRTNVIHDEETICQFSTYQRIKFDDKIKPICKSTLQEITGLDDSKKYLLFLNRLLYEVEDDDCHTSAVNEAQVELSCYNISSTFKQVKCTGSERIITKKCQIGYENVKLSKEYEDSLIAECMFTYWNIYHQDNDCKKICGTIDLNVSEGTHLSFRGHETDIKHSPWHAGIFSNNTDFSTSYEQICGGSIVHTNIVISAAHCFWNPPEGKLEKESNFLIGVGKTYRSFDVNEEYEYYSKISEIHVPNNYQHSPTRNDVAVLILANRLTFSPYIKPICLNWEKYENYDNISNVDGFVVGWGATSETDISSTKLLRINLTTLSNNDCMRKVNPNFKRLITNDKFCATNEIQSAPCQGDSGGGYTILKRASPDDIERFHLIGIVSVGLDVQKYCSENFIALFQNIQYNQDFIKQVISTHRANSYLYYNREYLQHFL